MKHQLLLQNINKLITLNKAEEEDLISVLEYRILKKKQFLHKEGEVCKFSAFVIKGCLRSYSTDRNGFEHILQFAPPDWWIADLYSLISGAPGKLNIDSLQDSEVILLNRCDQEMLFEKHPKFERFFRILTEKSIVANHGRLLDYMGLQAIERYEAFCKRYPTLVQTMPQKQIASYIGVTPEFLSKMKAGLLRKK